MNQTSNVIKGTFWGAAVFYFLIAFEFFYMAGPFAAYFYSAYAPALNFFNDIPILSWLDSFFLPHAVRRTSSALINAHEIVGAIFAVAGFIAFCVGACQVYYHKIAKKGIVTGGIYNLVRHPQYISFMICSFGLLILWPRYIVAVMFVTMIFAYYLLAKVEEIECSKKFGQSYIEYLKKTNMFIPFKIKTFSKLHLPKTKGKKVIVIIITYILTLLIVLGLAKGLQTLSINSLYYTYTDSSVNVAVCELSDEKINDIMLIVNSDSEVNAILSGFGESSQYINYILPTEWYAAEIPMNGVVVKKGHSSPKDYNTDLFKVIITKITTRDNNMVATSELLTNVYTREAITEVWIDLSKDKVIKTLDMPKNIRYKGIPVAIY